MNKENRDPNLYILKRREHHLSVSRSIPSIFRRRKRARPDQLEQPCDQCDITSDGSQKEAIQSKVALGEQKPSVVTETNDWHQTSAIELSRISPGSKLQNASPSSLDDHNKLNQWNMKGSLAPSRKALGERESQECNLSQKTEEPIRAKDGDGFAGVVLAGRRNATDKRDNNWKSSVLEDASHNFVQNPDQPPFGRSQETCNQPSHLLNVTEKK